MLYAIHCDGLLNVGEDLQEFDGTEAELTAKLQPNFDGLVITGWEPASFGDCWVKLHRAPDLAEDGNAEIDGIICRVNAPGTHPGGRAWWLTPVETVFVPTFQSTD